MKATTYFRDSDGAILNVNVICTILRLPWLRIGYFLVCTGCRGYVAAICCLYRLPWLRSGHVVVYAAILPLPWWVVSGVL